MILLTKQSVFWRGALTSMLILVGGLVCVASASGQAVCKSSQELFVQLTKDNDFAVLTYPRENGLDGTSAVALLLHFDFLSKARDCWLARLSTPVYSQSNLVVPKMEGAFLFGADLRPSKQLQWSSIPNNFANASLVRTNLSGVDLAGATLSGADFSNAILEKVNLSRTDLRGSNLSGANLSGSNLVGAIMSEASLRGANLTGADLSGADLTDCGFLNWKNEFDRLTKDNAEFQALPSNRKAEEEARFKVEFEARTSGVKLTGAKTSQTTKGKDIAVWKARGGIVVD